MGSSYEKTDRTRVRTRASRGNYDREVVHAILDEALICHLGFVVDDQPYVIPTIHARDGEVLYLHGSPASRMLNALAEGVRCCVTATLVDELVLARSSKQHSLNYRSAVVLGTAREVSDPAEKASALRAVVDHIAPGRSAEVRGPDEDELETTQVLALPIEEASAKVREGPPAEKSGDRDLPAWAGRLPIRVGPGDAIAADHVPAGLELPGYLRDWPARGPGSA